ncbi:MAG: 16S rRNA (cytosine(1402)-N(4))-methyltransferase RsmH [Patescibacteria group bacterium]
MRNPFISSQMEHVPVLRNSVQKYLNLKAGDKVVDTTLGLGGHALEILKSIGEKGVLIAFEQDERNLEESKKRLKKYNHQIIYFHENFSYLKTRVTGRNSAKLSFHLEPVDAILFDLGISSPHVDDEERGFSFMNDGPLDMRFDQRQKLTAADVVNTYREEHLSKIFFEFGEEPFGRKIARGICERRKNMNFKSTLELAQFIEEVSPVNVRKRQKIHPATRVFQALRIEVNNELDSLKEGLRGAASLLSIGGRIVVISYHSLEDRIVKHFFKDLMKPPASYEESIYKTYGDPFFEALTKKPVIPSEEEILSNPRSRSAKLRAYVKLKELKEPDNQDG